MINQFLLSVEIFWYRHYSQLSPSKRHLSGVPLYARNRWTLVRNFTVFGCLRLRMYKVDWNRVGEWEQVFKLKSQRHNMNKRDFLLRKHHLDSCFSNYRNSSLKTNPSDCNKVSWEFCSRCIRNKNVNSDANNKEPSNHVACHSTACHSLFNFFTCVNDSVPHDLSALNSSCS